MAEVVRRQRINVIGSEHRYSILRKEWDNGIIETFTLEESQGKTVRTEVDPRAWENHCLELGRQPEEVGEYSDNGMGPSLYLNGRTIHAADPS